MVVKRFYLNEEKNIVLEEEARWLVIQEVNEEGSIVKEAWIDLKEKSKDETKRSKCS